MAAFDRFRRTLPPGASFSTWRTPDGWMLRRFDCPAGGAGKRGSILFQGGRGDMIEKYLELVADQKTYRRCDRLDSHCPSNRGRPSHWVPSRSPSKYFSLATPSTIH